MESLSLESFEDTSCWIMVLGAEQRSGRVPRVWPSPTSSPVTGQSSQASKPVWQTEPPECGLLIEPWQWGKVSWGASMALAVLSFYNPGRWQRATSPCISSFLAQPQPCRLNKAQQDSTGWLAVPFGPEAEQGNVSCHSNPLPDPIPLSMVESYTVVRSS